MQRQSLCFHRISHVLLQANTSVKSVDIPPT